MAWVCVGGIIFCLLFKRASFLVFSLLTDKDELTSHKQWDVSFLGYLGFQKVSFLGYFIAYLLLVWFIVPLRGCSVSLAKL